MKFFFYSNLIIIYYFQACMSLNLSKVTKTGYKKNKLPQLFMNSNRLPNLNKNFCHKSQKYLKTVYWKFALW